MSQTEFRKCQCAMSFLARYTVGRTFQSKRDSWNMNKKHPYPAPMKSQKWLCSMPLRHGDSGYMKLARGMCSFGLGDFLKLSTF